MDVEQARLVADLVRAGTQPTTAAVVEALRLVTLLTTACVAGADGSSVTLRRRGGMETVASSNDTVLQMDRHQYETGQGPCLSAATEGDGFHSRSLAEEHRWPAFVPRALDEGIASILSTPLIGATGPLGALNIYSTTAGAFGPPQQELAGLFAMQATVMVTGAEKAVPDPQLATHILAALRSRAVIAQAQGVVMARHHIGPEEAAGMLHRAARDAGVGVLAFATNVVTVTGTTAGPPVQSAP